MVSLNSAPIAPDFDRETGMPTQMVAGVPDVKNPSPRHGCSHSERQDNETGLGNQIEHSWSSIDYVESPHRAGRAPRRSRCAGQARDSRASKRSGSASRRFLPSGLLADMPRSALTIEQDRLAFSLLITVGVRVYAP